MVHHIISFLMWGATVLYHKYPHESLFIYFIAEISGPFLHIRDLCKQFECKGPFEVINSILFCLVFIYARTIVCEYWLLTGIMYGTGSVYYKLAVTFGYWIGYVWLWQIVNLVPKI